MKKKEIFFVCIFLVSFCMCAVGMAGDYFCQKLEKGYREHHISKAEKMEEQFLREEFTEKQKEQNRLNSTAEEDPLEEELLKEELLNEEQFKEKPEKEPTDNRPQYMNTALQQEQPAENIQSAQQTLELPKDSYSFETVDYDYFEDALFIGDSRTLGLMEYGNIAGADFFAHSGMSVFGLDKKKISVADLGKVNFSELLESKVYGKVYLMLGINELGYKFETFEKKYLETVERIQSKQEDAVIYLCANMHVTEEQSLQDEIYNNHNINRVNEMIAGLADNKERFYIDVNELFDDGTGNLSEEYTSDAFHVYGKYYTDWAEWLCTKAIVETEKK